MRSHTPPRPLTFPSLGVLTMVSSVKLGSSNSLPLAERFWEHPGALGKPSKLKPPRWRGRISRPSKLVAHRLKPTLFTHSKIKVQPDPGSGRGSSPLLLLWISCSWLCRTARTPAVVLGRGTLPSFLPLPLHEYLSRRSSDSIVTRPSGRPPTIDK
ncbi:uncharacterized protein CCOS01_12946 [Colletotrichum costaricense]|uniref:Uncharacterized protein n=1 Tax=Colletotrichum costaricense TaxID=1209916 RepID=A0AAI9YM97_9PEZI|nr:uncharacterized protein CCOS01_12946 [Colletotrichum costaricense]KAK1515748.1 hypothetical protein CCOS01_12946 [Colletotrichum costaricense]